MTIKALVPIKSSSERLENKNFLSFGGMPLFHIILEKLEEIENIDEIIVNTDSNIVIEDCTKLFPKVTIHKRPNHLLGNDITMNKLIEYDISKTKGNFFIQTHVTNPLLSKNTILNAIEFFFKNISEFDSLFTVSSIKKRVYDNKGKPINHSNFVLEKTQDLSEIYIENSNLFIFSRTSFSKCNG